MWRPFLWRGLAFATVYFSAFGAFSAGVGVTERAVVDVGLVEKAYYALGLFVLLTAVLTGAMSNNATAALLAPLAIQIAVVLNVDPRPFLVGLTFAASAAFYTPIGYQTNLLVYGPGGYKFADYFRVGAPLTLIYVVLVTWLIPMFFPF